MGPDELLIMLCNMMRRQLAALYLVQEHFHISYTSCSGLFDVLKFIYCIAYFL